MKNLNEYIYLKDLITDFGGIEKFRFFGHLYKFSGRMLPFGGYAITSWSDGWVECKIEDDFSCGDLYTLDGGYKVKVVPVNSTAYASRKFYQGDLLSNLKSGHFIIKNSENAHIEEKEGLEHLCGDAYLYHQWAEVVDN